MCYRKCVPFCSISAKSFHTYGLWMHLKFSPLALVGIEGVLRWTARYQLSTLRDNELESLESFPSWHLAVFHTNFFVRTAVLKMTWSSSCNQDDKILPRAQTSSKLFHYLLLSYICWTFNWNPSSPRCDRRAQIRKDNSRSSHKNVLITRASCPILYPGLLVGLFSI